MPILTLLYTLLGLCVGSFLNVCIHRIPRGESVVHPRSRCPGCGRPIRAYDNVPVLSYLVLRGRCRACGASISSRYPFVELLTAAAFYLCAMVWGFAPPTFVNSVFLAMVIVLVFVDYDHQRLPRKITTPGVVAGLASSGFQAPEFFDDRFSRQLDALAAWPIDTMPRPASLFGAIVGAGVLLLVGWAYRVARKQEGLGLGDVHMMGMVGAFVGWRLALLTIFGGSFAGSIIGILVIALRRGSMQTPLPFGVFLGFGVALALFAGIPFLDWYATIL